MHRSVNVIGASLVLIKTVTRCTGLINKRTLLIYCVNYMSISILNEEPIVCELDERQEGFRTKMLKKNYFPKKLSKC